MIALLSNMTIDSIAKRLELQTEILPQQGFDTWAQSLMSLSSVPASVAFIILHAPAIFPDGVSGGYAEILSPFLNIIENAKKENRDKMLVVSTLDIPTRTVAPLVSRRYELDAAAFWRAGLDRIGVPVFELAELAASFGRERFYSEKMWFAGSMPFSFSGEKIICSEILRILEIISSPRKKCIVVDLDNTLWGGVVGEEDVSIAKFGLHSQYHEFQRVLLQLKNIGVLLAVASKNNHEDAVRPFRENPHMLLREEDFAAFVANWNPKPQNIEAIAKFLNIGLDSMVFIDDNSVERAAVESALPQVIVPEFPKDTSLLPKFAMDLARQYFQPVKITGEDAAKTLMYAEESKREREKSKFSTLEEYLASLEMKFEMTELSERDIPRAAQLTQKTNQFNLTTKRYTESDIAKLRDAGDFKIWIGTLSDKFGDYGKILLCIAQIIGKIARIDTFLMSCRAMGRGVERQAMSFVEKELFNDGIEKICAEYIETPKNSPAKNFLPEIGFLQDGAGFSLARR